MCELLMSDKIVVSSGVIAVACIPNLYLKGLGLLRFVFLLRNQPRFPVHEAGSTLGIPNCFDKCFRFFADRLDPGLN